MKHSMKLLAVAALLACQSVEATHFRYATYTWQRQGAIEIAAFGLNDNGSVVGFFTQAGLNTPRAVPAESGVLTELDMPLGNGAANGINASGQIVGYTSPWFNPGGRAPVSIVNGNASFLTGLDGTSVGSGRAVSDGGIVVGQSRTGQGDMHATVWRNGQARRVANFGGDTSWASAVNRDGLTVGTSFDAQSRRRAFLDDGHRSVDLGTLGGNMADANAVNSRGVVVGESNHGAFTASHAFVWRDGQMQRLGDWDTQGSTALGINDAGLVVGRYSSGNNIRALIGGVQGMHDLNDVMGDGHLPNGTWLTSAVAVNRHGQILAHRSDGLSMLLTPQGTLTWTAMAGGRFTDGARWDSGIGQGPSRFLDMVVAAAASQTVVLDENADTRSATIGSNNPGAAVMTLQLSRGAVLSSRNGIVIERSGIVTGDGGLGGNVINYGTMRGSFGNRTFQDRSYDFRVDPVQNHGLITGSGRFEMEVANRASGTVRAGSGESLHIFGQAHASEGTIEVFGGEMRWTGELRNSGRGVIRLNDGTIRFDDGLVNNGQVHISFGGADVFGDVGNNGGARIIASGGSEVTFWDAVTNHGEIRASAGSRIIYFGAVDGIGQFTTNGEGAYHRFEGGFGPGPGPASAEVGDAQVDSLVSMQIGGLLPVSGHDHVDFTGSLLLGGGAGLRVSFIDGFSATLGDQFDLFDYQQGPQGAFAGLYLPTLDQGLQWDVSRLYDDGVIRVVAVPEPSTYALMLAGLAACGWAARRSRRAGAGHQA